jgi:transcriptional regulator GlxA family with amidase domain
MNKSFPTDYEKFPLSEERARVILEDLDILFKEEKPYLKTHLTLAELARMLNVPTFHLSRVFNEYLKQNFFDFLNKLRVAEACRMLNDSRFDSVSIDEIRMKVGFNSSQIFEESFERFVKMSPREYRKKVHTTEKHSLS